MRLKVFCAAFNLEYYVVSVNFTERAFRAFTK